MKEKVEFKGSVVLNPVPVVLITSKNKEGKENVFTVGWIGTVCTKPPMLSISIRPERLSYEYIKETMEFTVNLPSIDMTKAVDYCGVRPGRKFDKIKEILSKYIDTNLEEVTLETRLAEDLGLNSYELMSIIGEIEEEFDLEVDEKEVLKLVSIADLLDYISNFTEENVLI